eukprot:COSAG05_NODE_962_length_6414_cov_4.358353_2_plen_265_part_00
MRTPLLLLPSAEQPASEILVCRQQRPTARQLQTRSDNNNRLAVGDRVKVHFETTTPRTEVVPAAQWLLGTVTNCEKGHSWFEVMFDRDGRKYWVDGEKRDYWARVVMVGAQRQQAQSECQSSPPPSKQPPFILKSKIPKKRHRVLQKGEPAGEPAEPAVEVAAGAARMPMMNDVPNHPRQVVKHRVPSSSGNGSGSGGGGILDRATAQHASDASRKRKLLRSAARSASCLQDPQPQKTPQDYQHELQQAPAAADRCSEPANSAR